MWVKKKYMKAVKIVKYVTAGVVGRLGLCNVVEL